MFSFSNSLYCWQTLAQAFWILLLQKQSLKAALKLRNFQNLGKTLNYYLWKSSYYVTSLEYLMMCFLGNFQSALYGRSWLNLRLMWSAAPTCFYGMPHRAQSTLGLKCSPGNSCDCYTNLKKENKEQNMMTHKDCMRWCGARSSILFMLVHVILKFCWTIFLFLLRMLMLFYL